MENHNEPRAFQPVFDKADTVLRQDSPFLDPGPVTRPNTLAIVQLSKDDLVPVYLRDVEGEHDGYKEGHVLNTRFGSFPHSTLIGIPWGSQVRASNVDTGSRGRRKTNEKKNRKQAKKAPSAEQVPPEAEYKGNQTNEVPVKQDHPDAEDENNDSEGDVGGSKRKRDSDDDGENTEKRVKSVPAEPATTVEDTTTEQPQGAAMGDVDIENEEAAMGRLQTRSQDAQKQQKTTTAKSGFVHILPPTPEIWTSSLPHRTQVVYTPDYSYVLQRIRARPGTRLIEAGSGSGSFTHAAARAVYNGCTSYHDDPAPAGKVFSFEFHEQRFEKMKREISEHGLGRTVEINHRDVYNDGFLIDGKSPEADAIFLDLPAPWLALPHLSRRKPRTGPETEDIAIHGGAEGKWISPLNPKKSVYICTFSPCIEQVTRTVSEMRKLGWVEIDMVEIAHKRINIFREKIGLNIVSDRGMQQAPKDVAEAVAKLKEIEVKTAEHNAKMFSRNTKARGPNNDDDVEEEEEEGDDDIPPPAKANGDTGGEKTEESAAANSKPWMQGRLVSRPETELKAHTSYLVFAIMPREWTQEDEAAAAAKWPLGQETKVIGAVDRASRKQERREQLQGNRKKNQKMKQQKNTEALKGGVKIDDVKAIYAKGEGPDVVS